MCKVVIDAFETEEDAVAFILWLKKQCDEGYVNIITTQGQQCIEYDGVDTANSSVYQKVVNIVQFDSD